MEDIGKRIKRRRKELMLSAEEVAAKMGVSPATVYRYESKEILNMGTDKLEGIARVLNTTPAYLMGWEEAQEKNDIISDAVLRMRTDEDFLSAVEYLYQLDSAKLKKALQIIQLL